VGTDVYQTKRYDILDVRFDLVSFHEVMVAVDRWREDGERGYITHTPPRSVMMCHRDGDLERATAQASLTLPDGVGIIWAAALLGYRHSGRVPGPVLMLKLCDWGRAKGYRHFFYGGAEGVADRLADRLSQAYPGLLVAGTCCPPFRTLTEEEDRHILDAINDTRPDIVWVGLGSPKQEKWMSRHVGDVRAAALIGVGAAFDFHSGFVKWAPAWIRRLGLETLHRAIQEPRKIAPRVVDDMAFAARVLRVAAVRALLGRESPT
jgi:N-acetylglucosaminyldiphosphoundecaprenol N-acetyl-beta-D-mannosaminyltransferase